MVGEKGGGDICFFFFRIVVEMVIWVWFRGRIRVKKGSAEVSFGRSGNYF